MPQVSRRISLEIDGDEGPLQGRVSGPDGLTSEFEGWLGLLTILVRLLDAPAVSGITSSESVLTVTRSKSPSPT